LWFAAHWPGSIRKRLSKSLTRWKRQSVDGISHPRLSIGAGKGMRGEIASDNVNMLWVDPGLVHGIPYAPGPAGCNNI
jgi:hypothetical protein